MRTGQPDLQQPSTEVRTMATATKKRKTYDGPKPEEKLVAELIELMQGTALSPWQREWCCIGSHQNPTTGNEYHGGNVALLDMYMAARVYDLPLWLGYGQAKKAGLQMIKGSKGCYIMRPFLVQVEDEKKKDAQGKPLVKAFTKYKLECVFNIACFADSEKKQAILDKYKPHPESGIVKEHSKYWRKTEQAVKAYHKAQGLETGFHGERAFYSSSKDEITMPKRETFKTTEGFYATWLHECVHSSGHSKRLNRKLGNGFGTPEYAKEELIAELGAYLCCRRLDIGSKVENHASYLKSWISCLKQDPTILFKSLSAATKAANLILGPEIKETK